MTLKNLTTLQIFKFAEELRRCHQSGFGLFLQKGKTVKKEVFLKPRPDTVARDDHHVVMDGCSWETYSQNFNNFEHISDEEENMLALHHPHHELLPLTQQSSSSDA